MFWEYSEGIAKTSPPVSPDTIVRHWRLAKSWLPLAECQPENVGRRMTASDRWQHISRLDHAALARHVGERAC